MNRPFAPRALALLALAALVSFGTAAAADPGGPVIQHASYTCVVPPGIPCPPTSREVQVVFDEPVDPVTAADPANYLFYREDDPDVLVPVELVGLVWENEVYVLLVTEPEAVLHVIAVAGVEDLEGNVMAPQTALVEVLEFPDAAPDLPAAAPVLLPVAPNPFNPATLVRFRLPATYDGEPVLITVHDLRGRLLRRLPLAGAPVPGLNELRWNGRDDAGRTLPAGAYVVRLAVGDVTAVRKVTLAK